MLYSKSTMLSALVFVTAIAISACGGPTNRDSQEPPASGESLEATDGESAAHESPRAASSQATSEVNVRWGEPLAHPEYYYGLYSSPSSPDRQWFVTAAKRPDYAEQAPEVPPGYLAIGAMFGDVAPWHMKTLSATEFEQAWVSDPSPEPVTVAFELGSDGHAIAFEFTQGPTASQGRLERRGDLPADWQ